ncbi:hypothetical protein [Citrobacter freundii]|uniref:hypothetical protein n=1 Tax=Citrobacter freundii TaxID=546 RepID=UPI002E33B706|nr:hypothetical protein [Citrobacter freundii]
MSIALFYSLAARVKAARSPEELGFVMCNDTRSLVEYRQAALLAVSATGRAQLAAHSGLSDTDRNTPYALWLAAVACDIALRRAAGNCPRDAAVAGNAERVAGARVGRMAAGPRLGAGADRPGRQAARPAAAGPRYPVADAAWRRKPRIRPAPAGEPVRLRLVGAGGAAFSPATAAARHGAPTRGSRVAASAAGYADPDSGIHAGARRGDFA